MGASIAATEAIDSIHNKKYVLYVLQASHPIKKPKHIDPEAELIQRRYTDFAKLNSSFCEAFPNVMAGREFGFPRKLLMGNFSAAAIEKRGIFLQHFLDFILVTPQLKDSQVFTDFLYEKEFLKACQLLDERRNELAVPILEKCFLLLSKFYMDRSKTVLLVLCRLVAACTNSPVPHSTAEKWVDLALRRYEGVCDADLLSLYIPLLETAAHLW